MELVTLIANVIAALANACMALRLLTFRRGQRRYRCAVSVLAWLLFNVCTFNVYWLLVAGIPGVAASVAFSGLSVYSAWLLVRHKGNLGELFYIVGQVKWTRE